MLFDEKQCYICKITKPASEFREQKVNRTFSSYVRLCSYCKPCEKEYKRIQGKEYHQRKKNGFKLIKQDTKERLKKYREENAAYFAAKASERRAALKQRIPPWADLKYIQEIYNNCPPGHEVDHIVPLSNKYVSGLHVEYNLQYLTAEENRTKNNHFPWD